MDEARVHISGFRMDFGDTTVLRPGHRPAAERVRLPEPVGGGIVIVILFVGAAVMLRVAVRLFQYGSISYTSKVNVRSALRAGPRRTAADKPPTTSAR